MTRVPQPFDVVKVPFPFTDRQQNKFRPAVLLSSPDNFGELSGQSVLAMITSAKHARFPLDLLIEDPETAGLPPECVIRMKIFTLDNRLIGEQLGQLGRQDQRSLVANVRKLFPFIN